MRDSLVRIATRLRPRLARAAPVVLIGVVPALLLGLGILRFMLNHFFAHAPYLLDTGMLSGLAYHDGLLLELPKIACNYADLYYDVYISPLTSLFSALSYIMPLGRLEWYALCQASVYVPTGLAVYYVASRFAPACALRRLPITFIAALAFSFNGLVLWMVGFPHFEVATPGLTCLVLAAIVTGRTRTAWVCLLLAASVRQDGGFHVALAVAPLLFLSWRGVAMSPTRRKLVATISVAVGISLGGMLCQKLFFHPIGRLTQAYLGDPLYSHLSFSLIADRARQFLDVDQVIYYPFVATCLIAALRRDPRYLLGWASTIPWFLFSFCAVEEMKATFYAYGVAPFVVAIFWVYVYGAFLAPANRRLRPGVLEAAFALVCLAATLGAYRANPGATTEIARDMAIAQPKDRSAIHAFAEALHDHRASFGRLRVDGAVATLAMEYLDPDEVYRPGLTAVDTIAFHIDSPERNTVLLDLIANRLDACAHVRRTGIIVCTHDRLPPGTFTGVAVDVLPASLSLAEFTRQDRYVITVDDRGIVFRTDRILSGWLGVLPRGTYEWTLTLATEAPLDLQGDELARVELLQGNSILAFATAARTAHEIKLRFEADGSAQQLAYRFGSRPATPLIITGAQLRRVGSDPVRVP